jgi:hypothetical protein
VTLTAAHKAHGAELHRSMGATLAVRDVAGYPHLAVTGPSGDSGTLPVARFDLRAIETAARTHGWHWLGGEPATHPPSAPATAPRQSELVLRDGRPAARIPRALPIIGAVAVAVLPAGLLVTPAALGLPTWLGFAGLAAAGALLCVLIAGGAWYLARRTRVLLRIDSRRIAVQYGVLPAAVFDRATSAVRLTGKRIEISSTRRRGRTRAPLPAEHRAEVLALLDSYGWQPTECS